MGTTSLVWHGDQRFTGTDSWGNAIAIDGDRTSLTGAKPSDLLPIAVAACTAYTLVDILRKQRQPLEGLETVVESLQLPEPPWTFQRIACRFTLRGAVDPVKASKALALAHGKYCSVAASISSDVELVFEVQVVG